MTVTNSSEPGTAGGCEKCLIRQSGDQSCNYGWCRNRYAPEAFRLPVLKITVKDNSIK
ncbi:hypothetical protein [Umezawaea sp. Da 62-37]|uniref:hypothetical protein n=1 Tax=Umezawaea sp. Da 62-37 TaxID=3075927 RepID=UPI0028F70A62|nr:hypothetical protein [Umezawaea sp. Da 62-37]WNV83420.1 hypothetical protein RM788_35300 [Umezawaea sp. Da 62-37]